MEKETKQFEDSLENWSHEERVLIEQMRSAYRNEMSDDDFFYFKRNFWNLYYEAADKFQNQILSSTGINREKNESMLFDFYFRTAQILAEGGFIADSIEFLNYRRDELSDFIRDQKMTLVSPSDTILRRLKNAVEVYQEKLIPQYIRDVEVEKPSLSKSYILHGLRSMMLAPEEH